MSGADRSAVPQFSPSPRLRELIARVADEAASPEEWAELETLLRADSAARAFYVRQRMLEADLQWEYAQAAAAGAGADPAKSEPGEGSAEFEPPAVSGRGRAAANGPVWLWSLAGGLAAVLCLWFTFPQRPEFEGNLGLRLAEVVAMDGLEWETPRRARPGDWLGAERLRLKAGRLRLRYANGAELTVWGPADLKLVTSALVEMSAGKAAVRAEDRAIGFTLRTPASDVLDLGTEFGVSVDGDASEVHVFEGTVVMRPRTSNQVVPLVQHEAGRVETSLGEIVTVPNDPAKFVGRPSADGESVPAEPIVEPASVEPAVRERPLPPGARIVFLGDAITDRETHLLMIRHTLESWGPAAPRLFNLGITFPLNFTEPDLRDILLPLRPGYAVLEFGSEIAASDRPYTPEDFRRHHDRLIDRLRLEGIEPILEVGWPLGNKLDEAQQRLDAYQRGLRELAEAKNVRLIDLGPAFRDARKSGPMLLVPNGVQLSAGGYRVMAGALLEGLGYGRMEVSQRVPDRLLPGVVTDWKFTFRPKHEPTRPEELPDLLRTGVWKDLRLPQPPENKPWQGDVLNLPSFRDRARGVATHLFKSPEHVVVAVGRVESPAAIDRYMNLGANVRRVWLNGAPVLNLPTKAPGWHPGKHRLPVRLVAGENVILLESEGGFFVSLTPEIDWPIQ